MLPPDSLAARFAQRIHLRDNPPPPQGYGLVYYIPYVGKCHWRLTSTGEDAPLRVVAGPLAAAG